MIWAVFSHRAGGEPRGGAPEGNPSGRPFPLDADKGGDLEALRLRPKGRARVFLEQTELASFVYGKRD